MDYLQLLRTNDVKGFEKYLETHAANEEVQGQCLLYWSVFMNNQRFCKLLIEQGAEVNQKDSMGRTPLSTACYYDFTVISRLLLENGAKIDASCMDRAYRGWDNYLQLETLKLLRDHGYTNLYLDDLRDTPRGFQEARTVEEAILIIQCSTVHILSLDHDLGMDKEGNLRKTGYDLVKYICENGLKVNRVYLHTDNVVGRENMYQTLLAARRRGFIDSDIEIYPYSFIPNRYTGE